MVRTFWLWISLLAFFSQAAFAVPGAATGALHRAIATYNGYQSLDAAIAHINKRLSRADRDFLDVASKVVRGQKLPIADLTEDSQTVVFRIEDRVFRLKSVDLTNGLFSLNDRKFTLGFGTELEHSWHQLEKIVRPGDGAGLLERLMPNAYAGEVVFVLTVCSVMLFGLLALQAAFEAGVSQDLMKCKQATAKTTALLAQGANKIENVSLQSHQLLSLLKQINEIAGEMERNCGRHGPAHPKCAKLPELRNCMRAHVSKISQLFDQSGYLLKLAPDKTGGYNIESLRIIDKLTRKVAF